MKNHKCIRQNCGEETYGWYCLKHALEKEAIYGYYDLITNHKGFRWWGVKRIFNYYKFLLISKI